MQTKPTEISNRNRQTYILFCLCCQVERLPPKGFDDRFNICQRSLSWKRM